MMHTRRTTTPSRLPSLKDLAAAEDAKKRKAEREAFLTFRRTAIAEMKTLDAQYLTRTAIGVKTDEAELLKIMKKRRNLSTTLARRECRAWLDGLVSTAERKAFPAAPVAPFVTYGFGTWYDRRTKRTMAKE